MKMNLNYETEQPAFALRDRQKWEAVTTTGLQNVNRTSDIRNTKKLKGYNRAGRPCPSFWNMGSGGHMTDLAYSGHAVELFRLPYGTRRSARI
jgi:hypothetical protein